MGDDMLIGILILGWVMAITIATWLWYNFIRGTKGESLLSEDDPATLELIDMLSSPQGNVWPGDPKKPVSSVYYREDPDSRLH